MHLLPCAEGLRESAALQETEVVHAAQVRREMPFDGLKAELGRGD